MEIKQIYPEVSKYRRKARSLIRWSQYLFLFVGFICFVLNVINGGAMWSLVVIWSLWMVWSQLLALDMVEYNRISQTVKLIENVCILLIIIGVFLAPGWAFLVPGSGWAIETVSIVCFCGLAVLAVLFFTDFERQKKNMLPLLSLCMLCILASAIGLILWREASRWAFAVMGVFAFALLTACAVKMNGEFIKEFRKRFSVK